VLPPSDKNLSHDYVRIVEVWLQESGRRDVKSLPGDPIGRLSTGVEADLDGLQDTDTCPIAVTRWGQ
jgi:hypothetical protein